MVGRVQITLTPTSYVVLGLIAEYGPSTPYDLKRLVAVGIGNFWAFPHAQLYSEPTRLAEAGLLAETREDSGRRRRTFRITRAGRKALNAWLADPTSEEAEIRDPGLLQLFFGDLGRPEDVRRLAQAQAENHRAKLAVYQNVDALLDASAEGRESSPRATLRMGMTYERASVAFWKQVADDHP